MREAAAQAVLLVRAFEEADPEGRLLPLDERRRATDAARAAVAGRGAEPGGRAHDEAVLAARADALLARLDERVPGLPRLLAGTRVLGGLAPLVVALGLGTGLAVNELGHGSRVQLLPLLGALAGLLAWNLAMYALFGVLALKRRPPGPAAGRPPTRADGDGGRLGGLAARALEWTVGRFSRAQARRRVREGGLVAAAATRFAASWRRTVAPLLAARARLGFHLASLALALGMVAGMFFRGVVRRYDVTWESTFLDADAVHGVAATLLSVAGLVTGRGVPSVAEVAAVQADAHGPAGRWIVLFGVTVLLFVGLPRLLLALAEAATARRLAADLPVDLGPGWAARAGASGVMPGARVEVVPYSHTPPAGVADALRALLHDVFGTAAEVGTGPAVPYGAEVDALPAPTAGPVARVLLFAGAQTPETEVHGRFLAEAAAAARAGDRVVAVVDTSALAARLGDPARVAERARLWDRVAREAGAAAVVVDLAAPGADAATRLGAAVAAAARG